MSTTQLTAVEPGNRIQLPADWAEALGLHNQVILNRTNEGIFVRPCPPSCTPATWEEIFATKLTIGRPSISSRE